MGCASSSSPSEPEITLPPPLLSIKVTVIGNSACGKTCLISRLTRGIFSDTEPATIGAAHQDFAIEIKCDTGIRTAKVNLWDTAGQERYAVIAPIYIRESKICIVAFTLEEEISDRDENIEKWMKLATQHAPNAIYILVGTKSDIALKTYGNDHNQVITNSKDEINPIINLKDDMKDNIKGSFCYYVETSAKNGKGMDNLLDVLRTVIVGDETLSRAIV